MKDILTILVAVGVFAMLAMLALVLRACLPERPHEFSYAEVEFLAADAHVIVGGVALTAPYVALSAIVGKEESFHFRKEHDQTRLMARLNEFRALADRAETAPSLDYLAIRTETDAWGYFRPGNVAICARLTRQWAKSLCSDPETPLERALPYTFYLVDAGKFDRFKDHLTVNMERMSDQLGQMHLEKGKTSLVCDKQPSRTTTFCTAALLLDKNLAAVWTAFGTRLEAIEQRSDREGAAIGAFVSKALGQREDFPSLLQDACWLRKPNNRIVLRSDPCAKPWVRLK